MKFFGGLMLFLGGALTGVAGTVGGVAIYAAVTPTKNVLSMAGVDASKILKEEYANKTIMDLITAVSGKSFETLGDVSVITPAVDELYNQLNDAFNKGFSITLDQAALYSTKFDKIGDYLMGYVKDNLVVGDLLKLNSDSNRAILYLCYPQKDDGSFDFDNGRTLTQFSTEGYVSNLLDNATLGDLLTIKETDTTLWALRDIKINNLENGVKQLTLEELITIDENIKILVTLRDEQIGNLSTRIGTLTLSEALDLGDNPSPILVSLSNTKITELGKTINTLRINQMITIDEYSPQILVLLQNSTLNSLSDDIAKVKVKELFDNVADNLILNALPDDTTITNLSDKIAGLLVVDVFADEIWPGGVAHTAANASSTWRYMLTDKDTGVFMTTYKLCSDMDVMMANIKANINKATISELVEDGYIIIDAALLNSEIEIGGHKVAIGDLTFAEFIAAYTALLG